MQGPDTLYVYHSKSDRVPSDTFYVKNEKFSFQTRLSNKDIWYVTDLWYHLDHGFDFWAEPGQINITSSYDSLWYMEATGSKEQEAFTTFYNEYNRLRLLPRKIIDLGGLRDIKTRIEYDEKMNKINEWMKGEILKHRDSPLGPTLFFRYSGMTSSESEYIAMLDTFTLSSHTMLNKDIKLNIEVLPEIFRQQKLRLSLNLPDLTGKNWSIQELKNYFKIIIPVPEKSLDQFLLRQINSIIISSKVPRNKIKIIGLTLNNKLVKNTLDFFDLILVDDHSTYYSAFESFNGKRRAMNVYFYTPQNNELSIHHPSHLISKEWENALVRK